MQTLHINSPTVSLGISKNMFILKERGKIIKKIPKYIVKRVVIETLGINLSSNFIKECATSKIQIDFIENNIQYAQLVAYNPAMTKIITMQAGIIGTPKQIFLAREFIYSKIKNQRNYLKYLSKYHNIINQTILDLDRYIKKLDMAKNIKQLMGIEGKCAVLYWNTFKHMAKFRDFHRIKRNAKDVLNASFNYAYAILHGSIQSSIIKAGLNPHISFLHIQNSKKPTLSFDLIEEFRAFVVDRTIVSMINRNEELNVDINGLLTLESRRLILKNIKERLNACTKYKGKTLTINEIIEGQCWALWRFIGAENEKYKGFIGKF